MFRMAARDLDIAFWNYDRTRALMDGSVTIEGVNARCHTARIVPVIFEAMICRRAYDVAELGNNLLPVDDRRRRPAVPASLLLPQLSAVIGSGDIYVLAPPTRGALRGR